MQTLDKFEIAAAQRELEQSQQVDASQQRLAKSDARRLAAVQQAFVHGTPRNKRQLRSAERAFAYPAR